MQITHLFELVTGDFDTDTGELICVPHRKYSRVDLCFKGPMHIPFARILLHDKDLAKDADQVFDSAAALGNEIARRWNAQVPANPEKAERAIVCCFCGHDLAYPGAEPTEELLKQAYEHEAICEKNPYLARIKELEGWVAEGKRNGTRCAKERDKLQDAVRNLREAKGQPDSNIAYLRLLALLPEST